jgi:hypothetical protein
MELTNKPPLSKEAIVVWWNVLNKYEFLEVENSFDKWLKESIKPPTPKDICDLCKHKVTIFSALPSPLALADNKRHMEEVKDAVNAMTKPRADYKSWARKIIANPRNYPDISLKFAKEALNQKEK